MTSLGTATDLDFVERFAAAAERFAIAVASSDMRAPVPSCPGWSTYDLVAHLGNVHAWAATIVETGRFAAEQNDEPRSHRPRAVCEWYAGKAEDLYEVLRGCDPAVSCWNFAFGDGSAGFWRRRQLHETTIHGVDLDQASGRTTEVDPDIATDGIDEVLRVFLHRMHRRGYPAQLTAPLCLQTTDTHRAWTLTPRTASPTTAVPAQARGSSVDSSDAGSSPPAPEGPPLVLDRGHPTADRLQAPAEVLYRLLWRRLRLDDGRVNLEGDAARVHAFLASRLVP